MNRLNTQNRKQSRAHTVMGQTSLLQLGFKKRPPTAADTEARADQLAAWARKQDEHSRKRKLDEEAAKAAQQAAKRPVGRPRKHPLLTLQPVQAAVKVSIEPSTWISMHLSIGADGQIAVELAPKLAVKLFVDHVL